MVREIDHTTVESNASRAKLLEFVESLRHECENISLHETWQFCGGINEWYTNWPHIMKLWQKKILVIPSSVAICERGFSEQNSIKSRLSAFIELGCFGCFDVSIFKGIHMDQRTTFDLWCNMKNKKILSLDEIS